MPKNSKDPISYRTFRWPASLEARVQAECAGQPRDGKLGPLSRTIRQLLIEALAARDQARATARLAAKQNQGA